MQNQSINNIGIIGCGWLGLPLAKSLLKSGFKIKGSTTNPAKIKAIEQSGIVPFLIQLDGQVPVKHIQEFLAVDLLIINVPPGRGSGVENSYLDKLRYLKHEVLKSPIKKIIFISSTSVYADNNAVQAESSFQLGSSATALRMINAENIFVELPNIDTTIIRMAGLMGPERHPGRFFAGKTDVPNGLAPVNLIHLDDCIGVIHKVITDDLWNEIFNAAAPSHPSKMEFYSLACQKLYGQQPDFVNEKREYKIIASEKIISKGYRFKHPDLLAWVGKSV